MNEGEGGPVPGQGQEGLQPAYDGGRTAAVANTAGAMLRHIRERAGIEAAIVASALKISPQMLQALEEDRYDALPDLAFARGLASSICRNFGADPKPVLAQMPSAHATDLAAAEHSINAPFRTAADRPGTFLPKYISRPLTVIVALFLLGSLLLWLWPTLPIHLGETPQEVQTTALPAPSSSTVVGGNVLQETPASANNRRRESQSAAATEDTEPATDADGAQGVAAEADDDASNPAADDAADEDATATASDGDQDSTAASDIDADAAAAAQKTDTEDDVETQEAAAEAAASDDLVIEAVSDESWISVHDRAGKTLYNALLRRGETARISGDKPLSATIGRKNAVTVQVHGQALDLDSLGSAAIARFEVD